MTVKELIGILKACPQDNVVIMASDAEGNEHSKLADASLGYWTTYGEFDLPEDVETDGEPNAICLYRV